MKAPALPTAALMTVTGLPYPLKAKGKVREVFDLGEHYLIVATDRLSAFDHILPTPIPDKGRVLNTISNFWFGLTRHLVPNHLTGRNPAEAVRSAEERALEWRRIEAMKTRRASRAWEADGGFGMW